MTLEHINSPKFSIDDHKNIAKDLLNVRFLKREEIKSFIAIGLFAKDPKPKDNKAFQVGTLLVGYRTPYRFSSSELNIIRTYSQYAAIILQNNKHYIQTNKQVSELEVLSKNGEFDVRDLSNIFENIINRAKKLLGGDGGKLYLKSKYENSLELVAISGIESHDCKIGDKISIGEGLTGLVFEKNKGRVLNDYKNWHRSIPKLREIFSAVIEVPLRIDGKPIGVLCVFANSVTRKFSRSELPLLTNLADQAALMVQNARLFEENQRHLD